jgi:hypothetical protein
MKEEILNISRIRSTGFAKYLLPCRIVEFANIGIIRCPRVNVDRQITDSEMFGLALDLSQLARTTTIDAMQLGFVREFLSNNPSWQQDQQFLNGIKLATLYGPIHGDFHHANIVRYNDGLRMIDFDSFELYGIHYFDFLNAFCFRQDVFTPKSTLVYLFNEMLDRWDEIEAHHYWNSVSSEDKKNLFYLFIIWRWYKNVLNVKSSTSDRAIRDILKTIRELPVGF